MAQAVEEWYMQMPIITRTYLTAAVVATVGCSLDIISPFNLCLHPTLVVKQLSVLAPYHQFSFLPENGFRLFVSLAQYRKLLEENSFRGRTADFFYMLLFGATILTGSVLVGGMIPYLSESFAKILFLSNSLTLMMVYDGTSTWVHLLGMIAGHAYYFLEDVYPWMTGRRPLKTPPFIKALFADEAVVVARPANLRFAPPPAEEVHQD